MASEKYTADDLFEQSIIARVKEIDLTVKALNVTLAITAKEGDAIKKSLSGIKGTTGGYVSQRQQSVEQLAKKAAELNILEEKRINLISQRAKIEDSAALISEKKENQKIKNAKELANIEEKRQKRAERDKTFDPTSMRGMEQQLSKLRKEYTELTKAERDNYEIGQKKLKQITQLANETDKLRTATGSYQQRVGSYSKSMREVSSVLAGQIGLYGGIAGGVMLVSKALGSGFNIIKNYSLEWSKLKGLMGDMSTEDANALQGSRTAGANLGQSATDVTKLQIELARFGLTAKEIVASTPGILKLATATGEDLGGASELVASNLKAFNLEASQTNRLVGVLGRSFNESALGLSNFTEASKYASTSASIAGVSFERMTAMLSVLADRGIKGSTAGTGLRMILTEMTKTGLGAEAALNKLAKSGLTINAANEEVGRTAQNALIILTQQNKLIDERTQSYMDQAKNMKTLDGTISTMTNNMTSDAKKLGTAWENMWISFDKGDGFISKMSRAVINFGTDVINTISKMSNTSKSIAETRRGEFEGQLTDQIKVGAFDQTGGGRKLNFGDQLRDKLIIERDAITKAKKEAEREMIKLDNSFLGGQEGVKDAKIAWEELRIQEELYTKAIKDPTYRKQLFLSTKKQAEATVENTEITKKGNESVKEQISLEKSRLDLLKKNAETEEKNAKSRFEFRKANGLLTNADLMAKELEVLESAVNSGWISVKDFYEKANALKEKYPLFDYGVSTDKLNEEGLLKRETGASLGAGSEGGPGVPNPQKGKLQSFLGFNDDQMSAATDAMGKTFDALTGYFDNVYQAEYDQYNILYQLRTDNISNLNDQLQEQNDLRKEAILTGNAFDETETNRIKTQLIEEERLRNEAIKKRDEAAKKQKAIDTIEQTSSLITTSATILKDYTKAFGIAGTFIAAGVIATMFGLFAATKIKANNLTKAEHGTFKVLQGDRHTESSGGISLGQSNVIAEGGEGMGIFSRNAMQTHGKEIEKFTKFANDGKLENYFSLGNKNFANFNQINTNFDTSKIVNEQKKTNELLGRQMTILPDGKILDAKGNTLKYL